MVETINRFWTQFYPKTVSHDIGPLAQTHLYEWFDQQSRDYGHQPALQSFGKTYTYASWRKKSLHIAAYLQQTLGLQAGHRIAFMLPNILQYPLMLIAAWQIGLIVIPINPMYQKDEVQLILQDCNPEALFGIVQHASLIKAVNEELKTPISHIILTHLHDEMSLFWQCAMGMLKGSPAHSFIRYRSICQRRRAKPHPVSIQSTSIALIQYTGGTTGQPKGALLTHRNLLSNIKQASIWIRPYVKQGKETMMTSLPLYHIFSLLANLLLTIDIGGHNHLIIDPRRTQDCLNTLKRYPITLTTGVHTLFQSMIRHPSFKKVPWSRLKIILAGGMALQPSLAKQWFHETGVNIVQAYGLTEASPAVCINRIDKPDPLSIGLPVPSTDIKIVDESGSDVPHNAVGELMVRGPQVMLGYLNQQENPVVDGWFATGDMGYINEHGLVYLVDRKKDMIVVSGFNVYPSSVEHVLLQYPGVVEACVLGVPHPEQGESIVAYIVMEAQIGSKNPELAHLIIEHARQHLAAYKVPHRILFLNQLPKSAVGKVLKRELRIQTHV